MVREIRGQSRERENEEKKKVLSNWERSQHKTECYKNKSFSVVDLVVFSNEL